MKDGDFIPKAFSIDDILDSIYLDQTIFKIDGSSVEVMKKRALERPAKLNDCLSTLENGSIYKVMYMSEENEFRELTHQPKVSFADRVAQQVELNNEAGPRNFQKKDNSFLIHIVIQDAIFNEKPCNIIYFRDVTFGVLYEQIQA